MKVSIVIPCYNQWQFLNQSVESAMAQTYPDIEVIVVDDGSPERPEKDLIENLKAKGVAFFALNNGGPSASRNLGIEKARGQLILPLDADDRIHPTYAEEAVSLFVKNPEAGIVYCDAEFFGDQTGPWELPPYNFPDILLDNFIFASAFFKREDWQRCGGYNSNMTHGWEDHDFWLSIISLNRTVVRIPKTLFYYRKVENSRTRRFTNAQKLEMFDNLAKNHRELYAANLEFVMHRLGELRLLLEDETPEMELKRQLQNLNDRIRQMETSGFWQLRNRWHEFKYALGLSVLHRSKK